MTKGKGLSVRIRGKLANSLLKVTCSAATAFKWLLEAIPEFRLDSGSDESMQMN